MLIQGWSHIVPLLALLCCWGLMASFPVLLFCCFCRCYWRRGPGRHLQHLLHVSLILCCCFDVVPCPVPLQVLLDNKTGLHQCVQHLWQVRESLRPNARAQATPGWRKQQLALQAKLRHEVAAAFPDRKWAERQLDAVLGSNDHNSIVKRLASLGCAASMADAARTADDVVRRLSPRKVCAQKPAGCMQACRCLNSMEPIASPGWVCPCADQGIVALWSSPVAASSACLLGFMGRWQLDAK